MEITTRLQAERLETEDMSGLSLVALHSRLPEQIHGVPATSLQRPLEVEAMLTRALDSAQYRHPVARQQRIEPLDERRFLYQRIAALEQALKEARRFAHHDEMTGVPNRRLLEDRFEQAKARSQRRRKPMALLFLDIDGFKLINDTHGHVVGDELLRQFAARLVDCLRASDTVCRYGGDEFVILLPESGGRPAAAATALKIREQLSPPYLAGLGSIEVRASIGTALYPTDGTDLGRLIEEADSAMYLEKASKRDEPSDPAQFRADLPGNCADGDAMCFEQTRTHD